MKVLLIDPPSQYWGFAGGEDSFAPSVALASLAAYVQEQGIDISILDCSATKTSWEALGDKIKEINPGIVGVPSSMLCFVHNSLKIAAIAKKVNPKIITVGGGIQFSLMPEEVLASYPDLDLVVRGDGEITFSELIRELEKPNPDLSAIKGISYRATKLSFLRQPQAGPPSAEKLQESTTGFFMDSPDKNRGDDTVIHNPEREPIRDLNALPLPAWNLLPMEKYSLPLVPKKWGGFAMITTSRGCPHVCTFCSPRLSQRPYRMLSAKRSVDMIEELYRKYDKRAFWLADLTFNVDRKRTEEFCDEIIRRGLKIKIAAEGLRAEFVLRDEDLLAKMSKAGVFMGFVGVETCSKKKLDKYKKALSPEQVKKAIRLLKQHKIHPFCFFIIGDWEDSKEDILETLEFAKEIDPTIAIFSVATPFPGTEHYRTLLERGVIKEQDWSKYDLAHPITGTQFLSSEEVGQLQGYCFKNFYLRPFKIIKHVLFGDELERNWYLTQRMKKQDFAQVGIEMQKKAAQWE